MKPLRAVVGIVFLILLLAVGAFAVRVARHYGSARVEISQFKITQLDDATRARLSTLKGKVFLTYFLSPRQELPTHMRDLERNVRDLFEALKGAAAGNLDYQIIDPHRSQDLERHAANLKISRIRTRSIAGDSQSEKVVWSGISIDYAAFPRAIINGIEEPQHLERLQAMIVGNLYQMENPRLPVVAVAAPDNAAHYKEFIAALSEPDKNTKKINAKVINFDFKPGSVIPREADLLFWFEPGNADPKQLRELNLFLESGHSAVVAGSEWTGDAVPSAGGLQFSVKSTNTDLEPLLSEFGLHPVKELVLDENCAELLVGAANDKIKAHYLHRVIGYDQDFRKMRGQPNGNLLFVTPTCITLDAERLRERRWQADLLVTSSDKSWVTPIPSGNVNLSDLTPEKGERVAKQAIMVGLRHDSPFHGSIVFCGAATPFQDGRYGYSQEGTAHWNLRRVLVNSLASDEKLVQLQAGLGRFAPIPELAKSEKFIWRALAVLLLPGALLILAFARGAIRFRSSGEKKLTTGPAFGWILAGRGAVALAVIILFGTGARALAFRVDLTEDKINILAAQTREIALRAAEATKVELYFSSSDHLPPAMRPMATRVREVLRDLRRAGANLNIQYIETDDLGAKERAALENIGIKPVKITSQEEESTVTKIVYSSVRLTRGPRVETLAFSNLLSFESVEFRLAFALWRLETGKRPHIAFASDVPRLTPAEDWDFQQNQSLPPKGADVYSVAREILKSYDFNVTHVNPRDPVIPNDIDLLIWFQPRRDICKMIEEMSKYLHRGGKVILAAQHFNMQSRQYRGGERRFDFVYWPQPQFNDIDLLYYPSLGIKMVNEVFFDDLKFPYNLDAQVFRSAIKEYKSMASALPFNIRAAALNFATDSLITKNLGDQGLLFSSFIEWDEPRLMELGIRATPLIFSSARSWSYSWKGGWIPNGLKESDYWDLLIYPPARRPHSDADGDTKNAGGLFGQNTEIVWRNNSRAALAVLFEGNFPESGPLSIQSLYPGSASQPDSRPRPETRPQPVGAPGKLFMIGCSEAFKNQRIVDKEFRADHFLMNSVAALALDEKLANIAARRPVARGFELADLDARWRWRVFVSFTFGAFLAAFGWIFARLRAAAAVVNIN